MHSIQRFGDFFSVLECTPPLKTEVVLIKIVSCHDLQENHFPNIEINILTARYIETGKLIFIDRMVLVDLLDGNYYLQGTKCCNYGADGKKIVTSKGGYDCILIPGATLASALKPNKICGNNMGIITATGTTKATLCCKFLIDRSPFYLSIRYQFFISPKSLYISRAVRYL